MLRLQKIFNISLQRLSLKKHSLNHHCTKPKILKIHFQKIIAHVEQWLLILELAVYDFHNDLYIIDIMQEMTLVGRLCQWWTGHVMTEVIAREIAWKWGQHMAISWIIIRILQLSGKLLIVEKTLKIRFLCWKTQHL